MGSSSSHHGGSSADPHRVLQSDRSRLQNLIYQNDHLSSGTSNPYGTSKGSYPHQNNPQLQLSQNTSSIHNSNKKMLRQQSAISNMSNFDKLSMKSQRIQQLNEMLNDEIKVYHREKKQQLLQKRVTNMHGHIHQHINSNFNQISSHNHKKPRRKRTQTQSLILGIWIGVTISIFVVLVVIVQINNLSIANQSNFSRDFPTWRGIAIWIFYVWMLGFDVSMYNKFRIRYRQIFKIKPDHYPQEVNIYRIAGFHSSIFVILFLFYVLDVANIYSIPGFSQEYFALISWGLFGAFLFLPLPILSNKGRYFVFGLILDSILSPCKGVTFPVTWLTDQAVSMAVPLKDLQYTICYYTQMDFNSTQNVCQDSNRVSTVMIVAVSVCSIRIIQCIRQGYDKGEYFMTPFFFNTLKYLATLLTAIFAFYYKLGANDIQAAWLLFAIISSFYSFSWDLMMDWDLLQKNNYHPLLRQKLIFGSPRIYYLIIFGNFVMRLAWIMTISPKLAAFLGNNNLVFLITGLIEIFRRGIWNLLRVQKQHIALISKPIKSDLLNDKALQLQKKLATVQHSLNLQIKMLKFFKKFQRNRQTLQKQIVIKQLNQQNLQIHDKAVENYNKKFQQQELKEISTLMEEILRSDSFLKKKLQEQQVVIKGGGNQNKVQMVIKRQNRQKQLTQSNNKDNSLKQEPAKIIEKQNIIEGENQVKVKIYQQEQQQQQQQQGQSQYYPQTVDQNYLQQYQQQTRQQNNQQQQQKKQQQQLINHDDVRKL